MIAAAFALTLRLVVLGWMVALAPTAPWRDTYPETAAAIASESEASPLFRGPKGPIATAALLTSVSFFESTLNPEAIGDSGASLCLGQVGRSNLPTPEGWTAEDLLTDVHKCVHAMRRLMAESLAVCRGEPLETRLGHYAKGRGRCVEGAELSRHRWALAKRLAGEP